MQINVLEYLEQGALARCARKVAVVDQGRRYTFKELAAFPAKLLEFMSAQAVSFIFWVPTVMVNIANRDLLARGRLEAVKKVFFAGEVFPAKHLNYWRRHLPQSMFVNRIELGEIEHAPLQVEGIRNCRVIYEQTRKEIELYFESDDERTPGFIRERLGAFVPKYMLPTVFHRVGQLPRNPNGKIDRQKLAGGGEMTGQPGRKAELAAPPRDGHEASERDERPAVTFDAA